MDSVRKELVPQAVTWRCNRQTTTARFLLAVVVACARYEASASTDSVRADSVARAVQDSVNRAQPGYIVDSIFPAEEEIRRFNEGVVRPARLAGGAASRGELVRRFAAALQQRDTAALRGLLVTRAEFGHFVFPESPHVRRPYKTKPIVLWTQLTSESRRGLTRLLERAAGSSVRISDLRCDSPPIQEGANRYWRDCTVLMGGRGGEPRRLQLFGPLLERDGVVKFLSLATDF